jgi:hypothetical protein
MESPEIEEWRCCHTNYEVSNLGNIRSVDRCGIRLNDSVCNLRGRILRPSINSNGYRTIKLYKNGAYITIAVHILVAKAFIANPDNRPEVNHKDLDKLNNRSTNLEWVTHDENMVHGSLSLLPGSKNTNSKLKESDIVTIRRLVAGGKSMHSVGQLYKVNSSTISQIYHRKTWRHVE